MACVGQQSLSISFATVADTNNFDCGFVAEFKKQAIVAATQAETGLWRLELFHIPIASRDVTVEAVQDIESRLAVDAAQIAAGFLGPANGKTCSLPLTHEPNSRRTSSCETALPSASDARARSSAAATSGVRSSSSTGAAAKDAESGSTITSSKLRTAGTFSSASTSSSKCACRRC